MVFIAILIILSIVCTISMAVRTDIKDGEGMALGLVYSLTMLSVVIWVCTRLINT